MDKAVIETGRLSLHELCADDGNDAAFIMRLLNEKGKRFFAERKIKSPAEFTDIADLEFADQKSIFAAVSKMDTFDLAKVLSSLEEGALRDKVLNALSRRRREEVESDLRTMAAADPMEVQQIGKALIDDLKSIMTQPAH